LFFAGSGPVLVLEGLFRYMFTFTLFTTSFSKQSELGKLIGS